MGRHGLSIPALCKSQLLMGWGLMVLITGNQSQSLIRRPVTVLMAGHPSSFHWTLALGHQASCSTSAQGGWGPSIKNLQARLGLVDPCPHSQGLVVCV